MNFLPKHLFRWRSSDTCDMIWCVWIPPSTHSIHMVVIVRTYYFTPKKRASSKPGCSFILWCDGVMVYYNMCSTVRISSCINTLLHARTNKCLHGVLRYWLSGQVQVYSPCLVTIAVCALQ